MRGGSPMRVFLSYRREDSSAYTGRLHDSLAARLGPGNVFQDVATITPGVDFREAVERSLDAADAALIVIGPGWSTSSDAAGARRLDQATDYVRAEIAQALARPMPVVPVLVGGARLPGRDELPKDLQPLTDRQAVLLHDETWHDDVDGLLRAMRPKRRPDRRRRWPLVAAGLAVVGAAIAIIVALTLREDNDPAGQEAALPTTMGECPDRDAANWTPMGIPAESEATVTVPAKAGDEWIFTVTDAGWRSSGDGSWEVLLTVNATNQTGDTSYNDYNYYALELDKVQYQPRCFGVVEGADALKVGEANDAVVGFAVTREPSTSDVALNLDVGGSGSIPLNPPK